MIFLAVYAILFLHVTSSTDPVCKDGDTLPDAEMNTCIAMECDASGQWIPASYFNKKCEVCHFYNDPHFLSYGSQYFDFHGRNSWFTIAQKATGPHPSFALFGEFKDCFTNSYPSCISGFIYKIDEDHRLSFEPTGINYGLKFNNIDVEFGPVGATTVIMKTPELVLAWMKSDGHLMIAKEKGFTMEFYGSGLWLRVPPLLKFSLIHGLCGTIFEASDKLVFRDGNLLTLPNSQEKINEFGNSWKAPFQRDISPMTKNIPPISPCTTNQTLLDEYKPICTTKINANLLSIMKGHLIDDCAFDQCVLREAIEQNPSGTYPEPEEWLAQAEERAERQAVIIKETVNIHEICAGTLGFSGKCFGTQHDLHNYTRCDSLIENATGCDEGETCCVDCGKQTNLCNSRWENSVSRNIDGTKNKCCRNERKVGEVRPGSGCVCCIHCKPDPQCKALLGRCITEDDPMHNKQWCAEQGGTIDENLCKGDGCFCCLFSE